MTATEFMEIMQRLGVTIGGMRRLLDVDHRSVKKWASGERQIPEPVAQRIRELMRQ